MHPQPSLPSNAAWGLHGHLLIGLSWAVPVLLQALREPRNFAALEAADRAELKQLVLAKQAAALEAVFGRLQANLCARGSVQARALTASCNPARSLSPASAVRRMP
jgi:hypothetical protein